MAVIVWREVYETGIVVLDNEHRELVAEINRLYEAVREKRGEAVLVDILSMLETYTVDHFQHEEDIMAKYGFAGIDEHKKVHQQLIDALDEIKGRAHSGSEALAVELLKFLRVWLLEHIVDVDKDYGAFLVPRVGRFID